MSPAAPKTKRTKKAKVVEAVLPVTTLAGKNVGEVDVAWSMHHTASALLLAQVIHTDEQHAHVRRAHTKDRSEVRGGGRKPWRQKGTGRARHASIRSPLWVGGGTTFGPRTRHAHLLRLPHKMRQRALRAAIGEIVREGRMTVVRIDEVPTKTRELAAILPKDARSLLIVTTPDRFGALSRVGRNMAGVTVASIMQLGVAELLSAQQILIEEAALPILKQRALPAARLSDGQGRQDGHN